MVRSATDRRVLETLVGMADPLNRALPGVTEVVVHDLALLPNSIIAIAGQLTGRRVGGPATDMLLRAAVTGDYSTLVGYESRLADGRRVRSTTIVVPGDGGAPLGTLCINVDVTMWEPVRDFVEALLPGGQWPGRPASQQPVDPDAEHFPADIDALAEHLLGKAIAEAGVPVELMRKRHKLAVVARLQAQGYFLLRDAIDRCATELQVTRYTIYNYLNELGEQA